MHNSGNRVIDTAPAYLRSFALFIHIYGFTSSNSTDLCFYVENK